MTGPGMTPGAPDAALLAALRTMWEEADPPSTDLADRMVLAVQLERLDAELLLLSEDVQVPAGARTEEPARTLTFSHDAVSVMVTITPRGRRFRLDGWVAPGHGGQLELRRPDGAVTSVAVDSDGRFVLGDVRPGMIQLVYRPPDGGPLSHPVAAPPVRL